jgi:hypothetical protein
MTTPAGNPPRRWKRTLALSGTALLVTGGLALLLAKGVERVREAAERAD